MPALEWRLWLGLAVGMALVQALAWLLARGLRLRLERAAIAGGLLLPLLLLAPWLDGTPLLVPTNLMSGIFPGMPKLDQPDPHGLLNDVVYQFIPWELEVRHALSDGRLPLWSDVLEGGSSPWANPQAAALSPLAMPARVVPIQYHLLAMLIFKVMVAFEGTWLLARRLGRSRPASLLAAGSFALSGGLLPWALFPHSAAAAWLPWLAAGTVSLFRRPDGRVLATTAAVTAALLLSGHPETAAIGGLFAGLCGVTFRRRRTGLARGLGAAALAAVLGFGLAAPQVVPFLAVLPDSQRAQEMLAQETVSHEVRLADPSTWFELWRGTYMLAPLSPHSFGRPYRDPFRGPLNWADAESGYAGLVVLAGTLVALAALRDRRVWPLAAFALLSLLLPARFVPLSRLLHLVPFLRVPAYSRFLLVGCLALALAGAFGIDRLLGYEPGRRPGPQPGHQKTAAPRRWPGAAVWIGLALAAALSLWTAVDGHVLTLWAVIALAALAATMATVAATGHAGERVPASAVARPSPAQIPRFARDDKSISNGGPGLGEPGVPPEGVRRPWRPRWPRRPWRPWRMLAAGLLGVALLLDLVPWGRSLLPSGKSSLFYPRTPFIADLEREVGAPGGPYRAVGADYLTYPSLLSVYGLAEPRPHNPLAPMDYLRALDAAFGFHPTTVVYFDRFENVDHPLLDFLGVRAVVASVAVPPSRTLESADGGRYAPFFLLRNPDALPRWFRPAAAEVVGAREIPGWIARLADPRRVALLREEVGAWRPTGLDGSLHPLPILASSPGKLSLALPPLAAGESLVASSVPFSRGWRATSGGAEGRRLPTVRVDGAFLGVRVPAGAERLDLRFLPPGLLPGLAAFVVAALASAALLLRRGILHRLR